MIATIRVEVCEADIAAGTPGKTLGCPVALAIKRVLPDCGVIVDQETITFGVRGDTFDGSTSGARPQLSGSSRSSTAAAP